MLKLNTKSLLRCLCMLLALFLMQGFQVSTVHAGGITEIVVFGDSLSDTGNLFAYTQGGTPPSPYCDGRFSNGRLWVERLATRLHVDPPVPSLLHGTNYAWGGAETGTGISQLGTPNIGEQINTFLDLLDLNGKRPTDSQLFVIWGGANDFIHAFSPPEPADLVANIVGHISTIADAAPRAKLKFLVPNLPPLGLTPRALSLGVATSSLLNNLSGEFNARLSAALEELAGKLEITIMQLDIFSLAQEIRLNPADFLFINTEGTAIIGSSADEPPDCLAEDRGEVPNPFDEYVFFDDIHPTWVWHQIAGDRAFELVSERPSKRFLIDIRPFSHLNLKFHGSGR